MSITTERRALSVRGLNREYGIARAVIARAIVAGEIPAARLAPRRFVVLRADFEAWLARHRVAPTPDAIAWAARATAKERGAA